MALFESYERRIEKINSVLSQYGISSVEECREICKAAGFDPYEIVKGIQPICFENACWAYCVGAAIALKKNVQTAAEAAEAIGIGLPGNGTIPAVYSKRLQLGRRAGAAIMEMVRRNICARDIINARSIRNALTCDMALGCSTNTVLHLLAIAQEAGCPVDLALFNEISEKTPNL